MVQFKTFVQPGRVAVVTKGPELNKTCMIVEIIDQNRVLVDGPLTGVKRQPMNLKRLQLTPILCKFSHGSKTVAVTGAWKQNKVEEKWSKTMICKRIKRKEIRSKLTDFDRFQVMIARKKRSALLRDAAIRHSLKKKSAKKPAGKPAAKKPVKAKK
ncbi:60S ribosomal protein L14 [Cichlidogyrus casuarinus]|uniref:Large ribosomal subunit protein eL14 n=1 Tax=Cichlidogyrus casuarinus TaxID=1844966 RepID=A0ABD2PS56_9PLAT